MKPVTWSCTESNGLQKCLCRPASLPLWKCKHLLKILHFLMQFCSFWRGGESFRFQHMHDTSHYRNTAASSFRNVKMNQANTEIPSCSQSFNWIFFFHHFNSDLEINLIPLLSLLWLIAFWFNNSYFRYLTDITRSRLQIICNNKRNGDSWQKSKYTLSLLFMLLHQIFKCLLFPQTNNKHK